MSEIVYPASWTKLKSPASRYECIQILEDFAEWEKSENQSIFFEDMMGIFHFFLDDHYFFYNPGRDVGLLIFSDEAELSTHFANELNRFHLQLGKKWHLFQKKVKVSEIPNALFNSARSLLEKMKERGEAKFQN